MKSAASLHSVNSVCRQAAAAVVRPACGTPARKALQWSLYTTVPTHDMGMPSSSRSWHRGHAVLCAAFESDLRVADEEYMKEYADLKSSLLDTTRKSGAGIAAYMLLTVSGQAAVCAFIGMGFSTVYLQWLFRDVDNVKPTDQVPMMQAKQVESPVLRILAMWLASYKHAIQPRLLVPVLLAALVATYNSLAEAPLGGFEEAGLIFGFFSYKVALVLRVVSELSPKEYSQEAVRPRIEKIDDGDLELDRWGRPKKPQFTMPTEALPEDVDPDNMGLLPSLLVKAVDDMDDQSSGNKSSSSQGNV